MTSEITDVVKDYVLNEFLPTEDPAQLTDSVPLIRGGILDSIATLKLAAFLEQKFQIQLQAHEMSVDHLDTIADIVKLVEAKQRK
jgi:acyl carrier protein